MRIRRLSWFLSFAVAAVPLQTGVVQAQIGYPSFQVPHTVDREFNFLVADASRVTTLAVQWREGVGARSQISFDGGVADGGGRDSDVFLILGGQYAYELARSTSNSPIDFLFTAGVFLRMGDDRGDAMSVPFGVSLGHQFPLEGEMGITPYVHPRISIDMFNDDTELNINFDVGASFDVNRQLSLRFSASLGETDALGFSVGWRPAGLRR